MVMGTLTLEPLFLSQFHFVLVGTAGSMRQGREDVVGAGEGPADFAPHPQLLFANQYLKHMLPGDSLFGPHIFKEAQVKGRQAIHSELCTRSEIER